MYTKPANIPPILEDSGRNELKKNPTEAEGIATGIEISEIVSAIFSGCTRNI